MRKSTQNFESATRIMPPPESEEEEDVDLSAFSGSFKSRGVVAHTAPKTAPKKLRKSGETPISTPMSRMPLSDLDTNPNSVVNDDIPDINNEGPGEGDEDEDSLPSERDEAHRKRPPVVELLKAEFVAGKAPTGSRTNVKDYAEPARGLLQSALHKYEVRIWTLNPYPPQELQIQWVKEIWDEVCTEAKEPVELTERMATMIKKYGSHARSSMNANIRPLVGPTYGFKLGDSDKVIWKNLKIYKMLLDESGFHYEDTKARTGYAKNGIVIEAMKNNWFKSKTSRGVIYVVFFSPISLVTLALIFTAIEFCIEEWSTGRHHQTIFDEANNKARYDVHLQDLKDWAGLKPSVTSVLLQQMHDKLRAATGAALVKPAGRMTEAAHARALAELEAMEVDGFDDNPADDEDDA
ncbi:hypothetical protein MVEN_02251700 [Mycena venus]|uniref:DUF6532 domain-containing protein n=1 Tax=Mycena venus TaxID=2733690 RepID=A0A8H6X6K7_9AGAR|nr:hypothetical protein MVEN_02251700 [Mycena venus]